MAADFFPLSALYHLLDRNDCTPSHGNRVRDHPVDEVGKSVLHEHFFSSNPEKRRVKTGPFVHIVGHIFLLISLFA